MVDVQVPHKYIFLTLIIDDEKLKHILHELGVEPDHTWDAPRLRAAVQLEIGFRQ
jgi:hypothetical protein